MEMVLGAMLIDAFHPSLKHRIKAFRCVRVNIISHIFPAAMSYKLMASKISA